MFSSMISSFDFSSLGSSITCWPSRTSMPSDWSSKQHRQLGHVDAERLAADARLVERRLDLERGPTEEARVGRHLAAQAVQHGAGIGRVQPRAVEAVVLGGRAEVPDDRLAVAGEQGEGDQLVASPLDDALWSGSGRCSCRRPAARPAPRRPAPPGRGRGGTRAAGRSRTAPPSRRSSAPGPPSRPQSPPHSLPATGQLAPRVRCVAAWPRAQPLAVVQVSLDRSSRSTPEKRASVW
jgi:hypothetical protein